MNDIPAFPLPNHTRKWDADKQEYVQDEGMTLRDYFAAKAMQGYCSNQQHTSNCTVEITADGAYEVADAMMKAREA